jgi:hypothetical protein
LQDLGARFEAFKTNVEFIHSYNALHGASHQVCMQQLHVAAAQTLF